MDRRREHVPPVELVMLSVATCETEIARPIVNALAHGRRRRRRRCERKKQRHFYVFVPFFIPGVIFNDDASPNAYFVTKTGYDVGITTWEMYG